MGGKVFRSRMYGRHCLRNGWIRIPVPSRTITERLVEKNRIFEEADAWLDLWCHTTFEDHCNAFSFLAPTVQYGKYGAIMTLETLVRRWRWEKTKVWRFFQKHEDVFALYRLPSSCGCLIFNKLYPTGTVLQMPRQAEVVSMLTDILTSKTSKYTEGSENSCANHMVAWYSRRIILARREKSAQSKPSCRVALFAPITRAYFTHGWNWKHCRNCIYDCRGVFMNASGYSSRGHEIRGPCSSRGNYRLP